MALFSMSLLGSTPIGGPIVGWIGEHIDPRVALLVGGVAALLASGYGAMALRRERAVRPAPDEAQDRARNSSPAAA